MTKSEQARSDAILRTTLQRIRNNYLQAIEQTLLGVAVHSGQPAVSRAFVDIHSLVKHAAAEIDAAVPGLREE